MFVPCSLSVGRYCVDIHLDAIQRKERRFVDEDVPVAVDTGASLCLNRYITDVVDKRDCFEQFGQVITVECATEGPPLPFEPVNGVDILLDCRLDPLCDCRFRQPLRDLYLDTNG